MLLAGEELPVGRDAGVKSSVVFGRRACNGAPGACAAGEGIEAAHRPTLNISGKWDGKEKQLLFILPLTVTVTVSYSEYVQIGIQNCKNHLFGTDIAYDDDRLRALSAK